MQILLVLDILKGSLNANGVANAIEAGMQKTSNNMISLDIFLTVIRDFWMPFNVKMLGGKLKSPIQ